MKKRKEKKTVLFIPLKFDKIFSKHPVCYFLFRKLITLKVAQLRLLTASFNPHRVNSSCTRLRRQRTVWLYDNLCIIYSRHYYNFRTFLWPFSNLGVNFGKVLFFPSFLSQRFLSIIYDLRMVFNEDLRGSRSHWLRCVMKICYIFILPALECGVKEYPVFFHDCYYIKM